MMLYVSAVALSTSAVALGHSRCGLSLGERVSQPFRLC